MGLFEHYKATPASILAERTKALTAVRHLTGVRDQIMAKHKKAAGAIFGVLIGPIEAAFDPVYQRVKHAAGLKLISSASLLKWATSVKHYDKGIDGLNKQYDDAKATSFGIDAAQYYEHGAGLTAKQRDKRFDDAVADAKSALIAHLKHEKAKLDNKLDDAADTAKSILNKEPTAENLNKLFQAGLFPLQIGMLFPSIDISKVDIGKLVGNLKKLGLLPPSVNVERVTNLFQALSQGTLDDPRDFMIAYHDLLDDLKDSSPQELSLVFSLLTPAQIAAFDQNFTNLDKMLTPLGNKGGQWPRLDLYNVILSQISPELVPKVVSAADLNPGFNHTDGYLSGSSPQRDDNQTGWHWGNPTGPLFAPDDDNDASNNYLKIQQGALADCWMITNMIAATEKHPSFPTDRVNQNDNGTITVTIYDDYGDAHDVTVSNQVVLDENGNNAFAHGSDGSTWPTYYEKAMALAYGDDDGGADSDNDKQSGNPDYDRPDNGNYAGLEWDFQKNAAPYVTGNDPDDIDTDYDEVRDEFNSGHPVMVSTYSDDDTPDGEPNGYVNNHVFYVKGFIDTDGDGDTDEIRLGNPWGGPSDVTCTPEEFEKFFTGATALEVN